MVVIRLARGGAKKAPFYQVVAADKRKARDSRFIEKLGYFNPMARGNATVLDLNQERLDHWLAQGAQPSDRVAKLLKEFKKNGVIKATTASKSEQRKEQASHAEAAQAAAIAKKAEEEAKAAKEAAAEEAKAAKAAAEEVKAEETPAEPKADDAEKSE
jgi:small subunit ribosomal protein S16